MITPNYLVNKYMAIKHDYLSRSPKGKWDFIRKIGNGFLRMIGVAIIDSKFEERWYSYGGAIILSNIALSFLYTFWYSYQNETPLQGILLVAMFGIFVSVCAVLAVLMEICLNSCFVFNSIQLGF